MIRVLRVYTGGNTSRPVNHHKARPTGKIGAIAFAPDHSHRVVYVRDPFRPLGGAA